MNLGLDEVNKIKNEQIKEWELQRYYKSLGDNEYKNFLSKRSFKEKIQMSLILIIPILFTLIYTSSDNNDTISQSNSTSPEPEIVKITKEQAEEFMIERFKNIGQTGMKMKEGR